MTKTRSQKFEDFQRNVLEQLVATNTKLDKICALLISDQLLQECIDPDGMPREPESCADIVTESFGAGLCLSQDLNEKQRVFSYHVSEFFIDNEEDEEDDDEDDDDGDQDTARNNSNPVSFF
jgi:hypothetical protein